MPNVRLIGVVVLIAGVSACGRTAERATADSAAPAGATGTASPTASAGDTAWVVGPRSIGPVRVGMTAAEARRALGLGAGTAGQGCSYLAGTAATRLRANVMLDNDTVVRFDVLDPAMATAEGARVGDGEARIRELYAGRVAEYPHKYVPGGHYLVVTPAGESAAQIIFETDGKAVTKYRAGRLLEVALVEGCG